MAKTNNILKKIKDKLIYHVPLFIIMATGLVCASFILCGQKTEEGYITLNGENAVITDTTKQWIEDANQALARIMSVDVPTDEETIKANEEPMGQGFYVDIDTILARIEPDGNNDNGLGWQCSKYTAYLATGKREYSTSHTDYGPVNGKDVAAYLVKNYGFKYVDKPVKGAIGSGGFNTQYGHTAVYLYATGEHTAMVNDANYTPLKVSTHNMNIDGWVWVVPGNYEPTPTPTPEPTPISTCTKWNVVKGDTMSKIMLDCKGYVHYGEEMNLYADSWYSTIVKPGQSVYEGWNSSTGVGLYAGDVIIQK